MSKYCIRVALFSNEIIWTTFNFIRFDLETQNLVDGNKKVSLFKGWGNKTLLEISEGEKSELKVFLKYRYIHRFLCYTDLKF